MSSLEVYGERSIVDEPRGLQYRPVSQDGSAADTGALDWYAVAFGVMVGGSIWAALRMQLHWDTVRGLGVLVACILASTCFGPLRRLIGHCMRTLMRAILYCGLLAALVWLLSQISQIAGARSAMLYLGALAVGMIVSIYAEVAGSRNDRT